jgi:hypothetical protein
MMKYLRRRTIIRESEFDKKIRPYIPFLYNQAEFTPIKVYELERDYMFKILSDDPSVNQNFRADFKNPRNILFHYRDYVYNPRYREWNLEIDDQGQILVQSRKNVEPSRLGWAVVEYWYE